MSSAFFADSGVAAPDSAPAAPASAGSAAGSEAGGSSGPSSAADTGRPSGLAPNGDGVRAASGTRNGRHDAGKVRSNECSS